METHESFRIPFPPLDGTGIDGLGARWSEPEQGNGSSAVLLAHGAGLGMDSPFMTRVETGLVQRGFAVLSFQYAYRERALASGKNRPPDRREGLEEAHRAAFAEFKRRAGSRRLIMAGKSLGGRLATMLAATGTPAAGLVLFGYPLHPPGKPEKQRSEHFGTICQPALFMQGTRDRLCDLDLLYPALKRWGGTATVHTVDGADHSFHVPRRTGRTDDEVLEELLDTTAAWVAATWPD